MTPLPIIVLYTHDADLGLHASDALRSVADVRLATNAEMWTARRAIAFPCVTILDSRVIERDLGRHLRDAAPDLVVTFAPDERSRELAEAAGVFAILDLPCDPHVLRTSVRQALVHLDTTEELASLHDERKNGTAAPAQVPPPSESARLLAAAMRSVDRPDALPERLLECLSIPMGAATSSLFLRTDDGTAFDLRVRQSPAAHASPTHFEANSPLAQRLSANPQMLSRVALAQMSEPRDRRATGRLLELLAAEFIVPLFTATDLAGWVVLGPRTTGLPYSVGDAEEVAHIAQAVSALLNLAAVRSRAAAEPDGTQWIDLSNSLSHELRNPLVAIKTFAQLLPERFDDPEFRESFGKLVLEEVGRITEVIDSVEQFAHPAPLVRARIDLKRLVEDVVERTLDTAQHRNLRLTVRIAPGLPGVDADAAALARALEQILRQADEALAKQADPEIRVTASTRTGPDGRRHVAISVGDNAPTLSMEQRDRILVPFASSRIRGTGLGLAEAQRTLNRHGGRIVVEANKTGNTLTMELPAATEKAG